MLISLFRRVPSANYQSNPHLIALLQGRTPSANHQSNPYSIALSPNTLRTTRVTLDRIDDPLPLGALLNTTLPSGTLSSGIPLKYFNFTFKLDPSSFRTSFRTFKLPELRYFTSKFLVTDEIFTNLSTNHPFHEPPLLRTTPPSNPSCFEPYTY